MLTNIQVCMGEMAFGQDNVVFSTGGIGSCLVICMFDREKRIGGLAHSMLPKRINDSTKDSELDTGAKYVDDTIEKMMSRLLCLGAKKEQLLVKLVGGATTFRFFESEIEKSVGEQNIEIAHEEIRKYQLVLAGEDVGGSSGKSVGFNLANGVVDVNLKI